MTSTSCVLMYDMPGTLYGYIVILHDCNKILVMMHIVLIQKYLKHFSLLHS